MIRRLSPIALRLLAVNIGAIVILGLGLLYAGHYEVEMIDSERAALEAQATLLASGIAAAGAVTADAAPALSLPRVKKFIARLPDGLRDAVLVFGADGRLLLDSAAPAAPPPPDSLRQTILNHLQRRFHAFPSHLSLPPAPQRGEGFSPQIVQALKGAAHTSAWRSGEGRILLVATTPVVDGRTVLGAVALTRRADSVEDAVRDVQKTVLKLFLSALLATILISIYLSETIVGPLQRLADGAAQAGQNLFFKDAIPDFSYRRDEIGALSSALRAMTVALAERVDAIRHFAADVAHEIRNPLASLKSAVETFSIVRDDARRAQLLEVIQHDIHRLGRLIRDISAASRIDAEVRQAPQSVFDLAAVLAALAERVRASAPVTLDVEPGRALWVKGNAVQIEQVFDNILENAVSFRHAGGSIVLRGRARAGTIVVEVDNDGPPIPERNLEMIFERFYSERPAGEGFGLHSGLGLSISRQIVHAHRGAVFAQNMADAQGVHRIVRFTVLLPAAAGPA